MYTEAASLSILIALKLYRQEKKQHVELCDPEIYMVITIQTTSGRQPERLRALVPQQEELDIVKILYHVYILLFKN